jgi:hypothetical protein
MSSLARTIIVIGVLLIVIGGLVALAEKAGIQLGRLPGDIRIQSGKTTIYIPLATTLLLSIVLTLLINIIARLLR